MERAARRFTSWVLSLHFLLLASLVVAVGFATYEVYATARRQALDQVRIRQELLAAQAARGISFFYRNILEDLELVARADGPASGDGRVMPLMWEKLRGRAMCLMEIDVVSKTLIDGRYEPGTVSPAEAVIPVSNTFRAIDRPTISQPFVLQKQHVSYVAAPIAGGASGSRRVVVAIVPLRSIESRFLNDLNQPDNMTSMLLAEERFIVSAEEPKLVGTAVEGADVDQRISETARQVFTQGQRITREFLDRRTLNGATLEPAMATMQPVDLPDGKVWWLVVSSRLDEVDATVGKFFRRAVIGAGILIAAITAILVSSSTQMIRGRLRLERVQRAMLSRELSQAREIQLMWLPEQQKVEVPIDVAAINRPASHVSGDFYNWFDLPDGRVCVVIGDVTGHGLPAAFLMATTQLLIRAVITRFSDPGQCLRETNRLLCTHVFSGQFVTVLVMVIDPAKNTLELATAGHPAPLVGAGDAFKPLDVKPQLVLAVDHDVDYRTQRFDLPDGACLLLYTDGVTDVQSPSGDRLGDEALQKCLFGSFRKAGDVVVAVLDAIDTWRGGREPADDLTLVAVQLACKTTPTPAATPREETAIA